MIKKDGIKWQWIHFAHNLYDIYWLILQVAEYLMTKDEQLDKTVAVPLKQLQEPRKYIYTKKEEEQFFFCYISSA